MLWYRLETLSPNIIYIFFSDRGWYLVVDLLVLGELIHVGANFSICKQNTEAYRILGNTEYWGIQNTEENRILKNTEYGRKQNTDEHRILRHTEYWWIQNTLYGSYFPRHVGAIAFLCWGTEGSCVGKCLDKLTISLTDWFGFARYLHISTKTTPIITHIYIYLVSYHPRATYIQLC